MATEIQKFQYQPLVKVGTMPGLRGLAKMMKAKIAEVLPKHITGERMIKALFVACSKTPKLLECTQESLCKSMMDASSMGLDCSGVLGSGYLVPIYNGKTKMMECNFWPGYRGLIDLARRGGQIADIQVHMAFAQDVFSIDYGSGIVVHRPYLGSDRRDEYVGVWAQATFREGTKHPDFMTLSDVERIRGMSKCGDYGPWKEHFVEMAKKTMIRRLCKTLPLSPELEQALQHDDAVTTGKNIITITPAEAETTDRVAALGDRLAPATVVDAETGEETTAAPETAPE